MATKTAHSILRARSSILTSGFIIIPEGLTSVRSAKLYLGFKADFFDFDELLANLVRAATDAFEKETDRRLKKRVYVNDPSSIRTDGSGGDIIWAVEFPIISVEKISLDGGLDLDPSVFRIYKESGYVRLTDDAAPQGIQTIRMDYTAGYDPVPWDLNLAANIFVAHHFMLSPASKDSRLGLRSRSVRDQSHSFDNPNGIPEESLKLLDKYRRSEMMNHRDPIPVR